MKPESCKENDGDNEFRDFTKLWTNELAGFCQTTRLDSMPLPLSSPTTVVSSRPLKYVSFSMMTWSSSSCLALSQLKDHFFRVACFTERSPSSLPQQYSFNTSLYFYCFLNPLDSLKKLLSHSTVHFSLFWLHCGAYGVLVP